MVNNKNRLNFITHSDGEDYKWAVEKGFEPTIIRNGISIEEFENNKINFREKYQIKEKYLVLNISNYFFGKGQEHFIDIAQAYSEKKDFVFVQISNTIKYPYDLRFLNRCKNKSKGLNVIFLRDIPREDVIAAFKGADVFLFTSKKEVAPIVILEARAASLPFVSLKVGDIDKGGIVINPQSYDSKGYAILTPDLVKHMIYGINYLTTKKNLKMGIIEESNADILERDWKNIVPLYSKVFSK